MTTIRQGQQQSDRTSSIAWDRVLALGTVLGAFAVRVWALDAKGLAYDEAATALMARATIPEIVLFHWDAAFEHLPLWIILMRGWSQLAGQPEFALRFVSALAGVATVPLVWALLRKARPADSAWRASSALLVAASPILILYSQEARMYALVAFLAVASTFLLLAYMDRPRWQPLAGFVLVNWAMLGLQYYSVLLLGAEGLFVLIVCIRTSGSAAVRVARRNRGWITLGALALSVVPLLLWMATAPGFRETVEVVLREAGRTQVSVIAFTADIWRDLSFGAIRWQPQISASGYLLIPVVLAGLFGAFTDRDVKPSTTARAQWTYTRWPLLFVLIAFVPLLVSLFLFRTLATRYIVYVAPFVYAFTGYGIVTLWRISRLVGIIAAVMALAVAILGVGYYFGPYAKSEYRDMARTLQMQVDLAQDSVLIEAPRQHLLTKYYLGQDFPLQPIPDVPLPETWPLTAHTVVPHETDDLLQKKLAASTLLWTIYAGEAEVDPGEFLDKYLTAIAYKNDCTAWLDVRLCNYVNPEMVNLPVNSVVNTSYEGGLELKTADLGLAGTVERTETATLRAELDWLAHEVPAADYKVSLRITGEDGETVGQADMYPIGPLLPPTTWQAGDEKPGYMSVQLPPDLPVGVYSVQASLYDPATLQPAEILTTDGRLAGDSLELGLLEIDDTMRLRSSDDQSGQ